MAYFYNYVDSGYLQNARNKARKIRPLVKKNEDGSFNVKGGSDYNVKFVQDNQKNLGVECDCVAGKNSLPCYHGEACLPFHLEDLKVAGKEMPEMWTPVSSQNISITVKGQQINRSLK